MWFHSSAVSSRLLKILCISTLQILNIIQPVCFIFLPASLNVLNWSLHPLSLVSVSVGKWRLKQFVKPESLHNADELSRAKAYIQHVTDNIEASSVSVHARVSMSVMYAGAVSVNSDTCGYNYHTVIKMSQCECLAGCFIAGFNLWPLHISLLIW